MSLFQELKRRNVFRVGAAYLVVGWLLVEVGSVVFESFEAPHWVIKVFIAVIALGLPLALVFAWAFEKTPEGIKLERNVDRSQSITEVTGKKLDRTIIVVLALAVVYFAVDKFALREDAGQDAAVQVQAFGVSSEPSIAVLPFVNMSEDPANEYFSDGISEELLNVLVKVSGIKVASRTSSFAFKGTNISIPEIAAQLKVDHVLEGSVRKAGNKVRVTAQLIEVRNDRHLWSETYDRELEDIFAIQDEISGHIVDALKVALGAGEQQAMSMAGNPTENLGAYELYLQGRYFWQRRGEENIRRAIQLFKQATDMDPGFARAWSGLAAAYVTLPAYSDTPRTETNPLAETAARQALQLDDSIADAHAVLADVFRAGLRWADARRSYLAAIEREPRNVTPHLWYAEYLFELGKLQDALVENRIALELDPMSPGANNNLAANLIALGDYEGAMRYARAGSQLGADWGWVQQGIILSHQGRYQDAIAAFEAADPAEGISGTVYVAVAEALENPDSLPQQLERLRGLSDQGAPISDILLSHILLQQVSAVYELFETRLTELQIGANWFDLWTLDAASLRADPRFGSLVERLGMLEHWRQSGWPDLCEPDGEGVTCR